VSNKWKFERLYRNSFKITVPTQATAEFEWWFLLTSDQHWDNPKSDHELQRKHLEQAKKRGAAVMSCGDLFCLMQGKYDKRASKSAVRPEHQNDNYLDSVINTAVDFFKPYAKNFTVIATGNHEQAIADRYETNMIDRFAGAINNTTGSNICNGGFSGFIRFVFERLLSGGTKPSSSSVLLHYDHGYGGGGPISADMIQSTRRMLYIPEADIIAHGHTHDKWVREFARKRVSSRGAIYHDVQTHIKLPSYKDDYSDGYGGWAAAKKGMPPKPLGAWWLRFYWSKEQERVIYEVIPTQNNF